MIIKISKLFFIVIVIIIVFNSILDIGFSTRDDDWMLLNNPFVLMPNDENWFWWIKGLFLNYWDIQYSPLNTIYYSLVYKINGYDSFYFHLSSIVIHIMNGVLLCKLGEQTYILFQPDFNRADLKTICYISTFFWLIAPINVEAVVWIAASKVLLCTMFTILCLIFFISSLLNIDIDSLKSFRIRLVLSFTCFFLSFFFKEQAFMTPLIIGAILFYYTSSNMKMIGKIFLKQLIIYLILMFIFSIIFVYITLDANQLSNSPFYIYPLCDRLVLSFYCFFKYVFDVFIPMNLHYAYKFPMAPQENLPFIYYLFIVLFFIIIWQGYKIFSTSLSNYFFELLCISIFISQIVLVLQIFPLNRPMLSADRYMYLSSFFLILFASKYGFKLYKRYRTLLYTLLIGLGVYFFMYSSYLASVWHF